MLTKVNELEWWDIVIFVDEKNLTFMAKELISKHLHHGRSSIYMQLLGYIHVNEIVFIKNILNKNNYLHILKYNF